MSSDKDTITILAKVHIKGTTHDGGYCSDPYDLRDVDTTTDEEMTVPSKQFVRDYCDRSGEVDYDGLAELSSVSRLCSGSGYCGTEVRKTVTKAVLKKRRNNFKNECLDALSSDEEEAPPSQSASVPFVNSFRGRINSTYTANRNWYSKPKKTEQKKTTEYNSKFDNPEYQRRVAKIPCNRGRSCPRKDSVSKPCYYKHV